VPEDGPGRGRAGRALALSALLVLAVLAIRTWQNRDVVYDRFKLPAFDGHVYAAMSEEPRVFTIAPWGYRLLMPWLVHVSPWNAARGFAWFTPAAMLLAGVAAAALLRRLGFGAVASALAAAALVASDPVGRILRYRILVDPLAVALEALFLLALVSGASWPVLALVGVLGTASKEFFLLLLPAVFLARRGQGRARAAWQTAGVVAPSLLWTLVLRLWWTPYLASEGGGAPPVLARVLEWLTTQTVPAVWILVLAAVGVAGAVRPQARPWRWPFAYVAAVALVAPFLNPSDFSAADLPRLHVYVLPALLPLILLAIDRFRPLVGAPLPQRTTPGALTFAALGAAALVALSPFALLDRYRRVDLRPDGDAARVLATCRGTLVAAGRLARGEEVAQDAVRPGADDPGEPRLRWYVRDGWQMGDGAAVLGAAGGTLIVPARPPRPLEVALELASDPGPAVRASIEGRPLDVEHAGSELRVRLPVDALVRGDNRLALKRDPAASPLQLRRLRIRPLP
jgi:hypothetical protein